MHDQEEVIIKCNVHVKVEEEIGRPIKDFSCNEIEQQVMTNHMKRIFFILFLRAELASRLQRANARDGAIMLPVCDLLYYGAICTHHHD